MSEAVISVRGLRKSYGEVEAVRGLDLEVRQGEIFAFLGPNGAGKTTTVEILEGYRDRTDGDAEVLGVDPARPTREWREQVGIVLQQCRMRPELTVRETLELYAGYYREARPVGETIERAGLGEKADERTGHLSGGQKRRLDVAVALVGDPDLLFLDEPTTGFDPSARRQAWGLIGGLRDLGKTVLLTTHYMDEAQALADRVAVIAQGRIVAAGTPAEIGARETHPATITFRVPRGVALADLPLDGADEVGERDGLALIKTASPVPLLNGLTAWALERGEELPGLEVRRPTLEDIYLELTSAEGEDEDAGR